MEAENHGFQKRVKYLESDFFRVQKSHSTACHASPPDKKLPTQLLFGEDPCQKITRDTPTKNRFQSSVFLETKKNIPPQKKNVPKFSRPQLLQVSCGGYSLWVFAAFLFNNKMQSTFQILTRLEIENPSSFANISFLHLRIGMKINKYLVGGWTT